MDGDKTEGAVDKMDCTNILIRGLFVYISLIPGLESICNGNVQLNSNLNEISHTFKLASIYYGPSLHILTLSPTAQPWYRAGRIAYFAALYLPALGSSGPVTRPPPEHQPALCSQQDSPQDSRTAMHIL